MQNVKKLIKMNLIIVSKNDTKKCETSVMKKMHKSFNHQSMQIVRRADKSRQKFHTNLIDDENIVLIFRKKRYAIIFVNDFSNYI